ncbi:MAG: endoribonuclease MazF [Candidatus Rokuibacteriota bacterium]
MPARGDLIWLQFNPQAGHEQAGHRPAVVISPSSYNRRVGLALCCPVTSQVKGYPFEVVLPPGLGVEGAILSDQIKSLDWRVRKARRISNLPAEVLQETVGKILALVELDRAR